MKMIYAKKLMEQNRGFMIKVNLKDGVWTARLLNFDGGQYLAIGESKINPAIALDKLDEEIYHFYRGDHNSKIARYFEEQGRLRDAVERLKDKRA